MNGSTPALRSTALAILIAALAAPAMAHGGVYSGPAGGVGSGAGGGGTGRGGGRATPSRPPPASTPDTTRWETWWAWNREDFLVARGSQGAEQPSGYGEARPLSQDEIRSQVVPALLLALKDRDADVRDSAAIALGKVGDGRDAPTLVSALEDRQRSVVEAAIVGLGLLRDPAGEAALGRILADATRSARERSLAAVALGLSGGDSARSFLFADLGAPDEATSGSRIKAGNIDAARALGAALWAGADHPGGNLERSPLSAALLQRALGGPAAKDRIFAAIGTAALAKARDPGSLQFVLDALNDTRAEVRSGAFIAAGRVVRADDTKSVRAVAAALARESDPVPKRLALIALGRIGGPEARKLLEQAFGERDRQNRAFAAIALGICGDVAYAPVLRTELADSGDVSLRGAIAVALGLMRDVDSYKLIADTVRGDRNPELLSHLMWYFALNRTTGAAPLVSDVLAKSKSGDLQAAAAITLGLLGVADAAPKLSAMLTGNNPIMVKAAAATGLGRSGDRRALEPLMAIAKSGAEQDVTRAFAVVAIGILAQKEPWLQLPRVAIDANYDVRHEALDELRDIL